jgi:hypothetical protein
MSNEQERKNWTTTTGPTQKGRRPKGDQLYQRLQSGEVQRAKTQRLHKESQTA